MARDGKKAAWTPEEDEALRRAVRAHRRQNWSAIAAALPERGPKSCRLRWYQHLAPELDSRPFTPEEDACIVQQQRLHGNKWATIAFYLHGRSDNAVKNRWNSALKKQGAPGEADDANADGQACLNLFPSDAEGLNEAASADRPGDGEEEGDMASTVLTLGLPGPSEATAEVLLGVGEEEGDAASLGLTLGLSEAELALSLGPVRPS